MTTLESLRKKSFSTLADAIGQGVDVIIEEWNQRSRSEREHSRGTHRDELNNRLPGFLRALSEFLRTPEADAAPRILALEHGEQRWKIGWELSEVVNDYQLLRQVLHDHFESGLDRQPTREEVRAIDLHIDDAIRAAVVAYSEHQEVQLRQAHQRLNEFLGVLGHELRNPLNAVSMGIHVLRRGVGDSEETCSMVQNQLGLMTRLLEDMLDITRITRNQVPLNPQPITIQTILQQAEEGNRSGIATKNHSVTIDMPSEPIWIKGDEGRLTQVFSNLLGNAVKYTESNGEISIDVKATNEQVQVRVRDNGKGIDVKTLPNVFDLFVQSPENIGLGLGIGLALARALVEAHGGRIEAHSAGIKAGSEFSVWLPMLTDQPIDNTPTIDAADSLPSTTPGCRVLVIDDDEPSSRMLQTLLQECGHETIVAHDGETGLEIALQEVPDVILLDVGLPKVGGYEIAGQLRARAEFQRTLVIVMTGYAQEPNPEMLAEVGVDEHLVKPVDIAMIQAIIAEHQCGDAKPSS